MFVRSLLRNGTAMARAPVMGSLRCASGSAAEGAQRDLVNFPRVAREETDPPVKFSFLPQTWFDALYEKTGVSGPYCLTIGGALFLMSKELWVIEHEFVEGFYLILVWGGLIKYLGPKYNEWAAKQIAEDSAKLDTVKTIPIAEMKESLVDCAKQIDSANHSHLLFDARKENVQLQLEAAYRKRLVEAHHQVKQKLDYQLKISTVKKEFEQKHMVDWIVKSVRASITPAQEAATLKQCLVDLKSLAPKTA